jgi:hypothetical protein
MGKYKNSNSYIESGETNYRNSPLGTKTWELANLTPQEVE